MFFADHSVAVEINTCAVLISNGEQNCLRILGGNHFKSHQKSIFKTLYSNVFEKICFQVAYKPSQVSQASLLSSYCDHTHSSGCCLWKWPVPLIGICRFQNGHADVLTFMQRTQCWVHFKSSMVRYFLCPLLLPEEPRRRSWAYSSRTGAGG